MLRLGLIDDLDSGSPCLSIDHYFGHCLPKLNEFCHAVASSGSVCCVKSQINDLSEGEMWSNQGSEENGCCGLTNNSFSPLKCFISGSGRHGVELHYWEAMILNKNLCTLILNTISSKTDYFIQN